MHKSALERRRHAYTHTWAIPIWQRCAVWFVCAEYEYLCVQLHGASRNVWQHAFIQKRNELFYVCAETRHCVCVCVCLIFCVLWRCRICLMTCALTWWSNCLLLLLFSLAQVNTKLCGNIILEASMNNEHHVGIFQHHTQLRWIMIAYDR